MAKRNYPAFRVVDLSECRELRTYAQSKVGQASSQETMPPVPRSSATASFSEHDREPLATLFKWPSEVSQRSASSRRASAESDFQYGLNSMTESHHTVLFFATPKGEFTKWCKARDNSSMDKPEIRRENLRRFVALRLDGNNAHLSRLLGNESTTYVNDLLRPGSTKSFGEKAAANIEDKIGLKAGQLDMANSPLLMDESRRDQVDDEIKEKLAGMTKAEKLEALDSLRGIYLRRKKTRRAS